MEHFIIIRFSVKFNNRPEFKNKEHILLSEKRMNFRFELFEKFCLPSLKNQTLNDFKIIIIYDKDLDEKYKNKLKNLCSEDYFILHEWIFEDELNTNEWLKPYIINKDENNYIITTRLDDDDIINFKLNERFKAFVNKFNVYNKIISFRGGHFLNIDNENNMKIFKVNYNSLGVFLSLCHKINQPNVYNYIHHNHNMPKRVIHFKNAFIVTNHIYENDNRLERFTDWNSSGITYNEIIKMVSN